VTSWLPELMLHPEHLPWSLDATGLGLRADGLDALPWEAVFDEMEALEAGAIANADEQRAVGHYWLRAPELAPTVEIAMEIEAATEQVRALAASVREGEAVNALGQRFTDLLLVGIGGSALGPALVLDALADDATGQPRGLRFHVLDNTDPDGVARVLGGLGARLDTTLVLVISKSGSTPEPANTLALVRSALAARVGRDAPSLVAVTVAGSKLDKVARAEQWRAVLPMWEYVGGRYSWSSAVGALPAELAGVDTTALLAGARDMDAWTRQRAWRDNPAALLAGGWFQTGGGRGDRAMVVLPYADRLVLFGKYLQQLVMESLGKAQDRAGRDVHQGLTVYGNKGSTDQHAYVQQLRDGRDDFFVLFIQVLSTLAADPELPDGHRAGDHLQGFLLGTRRALRDTGRRSMTITVPVLDAYALGGLMALFERAVGLYASLININAYHQPGVEAGKKAAKEMLDLGRAARAALSERPRSVPELAAALGADPVELLYLLGRMANLGIARSEGGTVDGTWHLA
jgi:glucose-6-phosphate isomerase